ncbi:MAG TPA: OstA-like protein [Bacteroidales bacterium]|nr:OstA-like protein [Bacteroidales bacterium]
MMKNSTAIRSLVIGLMLLISLNAPGQEKKGSRKIEILHANSLEYSEKVNANVRRFIGDVKFRHNEFTMYCDSAYSYTNKNQIDAFSNVHINRGDTLHLYGDFLSYDGNANFGKVRKNVRLTDPQATLYTDSLNFYTERNYAYYFDGGRIDNEDKTITSIEGHYYSDRNIAHFKDSVTIKDPDYTVHADTLKYNTQTEVAFFFGPTNIYSDKNYLYCENGWYKTKSDQFFFSRNARYEKGDRIIKGDTLSYDDSTGYGEIRSNAEIIDTSSQIILRGNYSEYTDEPQKAFMTDSAHLISVDNQSDSLYLHADTLKSHYDTTGQNRIFKAYYNAKIFKSNLQGRCDSLTYTEADSIIRMYVDPVIWNDSTQISANFIEIHTQNNNISKFRLENAAFMISMEDTARFNQIKGKTMIGHFTGGKLQKVRVNGNGETIYYTKDKNQVVGVNKAVSSNLLITLKDNEVTRVTMLQKPEGVLYPPTQLKETKLDGFRWLISLRPKSKYDIFRKDDNSIKEKPQEDQTPPEGS